MKACIWRGEWVLEVGTVDFDRVSDVHEKSPEDLESRSNVYTSL
jgi:hypothetical protein